MAKVACLMIQKNETVLLEHWIIYYGELFGYDNLYVWDNASDAPEIAGLIEKWTDRGVTFLEGAGRPERYSMKGRLFANQAKLLDRFAYYDFILPVDCDEFLALRAGPDGIIETRPDALHAALDTLDPDAGIFAIDYNYPNDPASGLEYFGWDFNKKFARAGHLGAMDHGGHEIVSPHPTPVAPTSFAYIHYYHRPFALMREAAEAKLILTPEVLSWPDHRKRDHRLAKYLVMSEQDYADELRTLSGNRKYTAPHLAAFFARFGRTPPFA